METSLQNDLARKYPLLFADYNSTVSVSPFSDYGIECGDGWFQLIDNLCASLEDKVRAWQTQNPDKKHPRIAQVKEKFGGLRFYMDYPSGHDNGFFEEFEVKLITPVQNLSYTVCEVCGGEGKEIYGAWIKTLCESCNNKRNKK